MEDDSFRRDLHEQYFNWMLLELPGAYESEEVNRLTFAYFAISALDILDSLDHVSVEDTIAWVYGLQVLPQTEVGEGNNETTYGFRGSPSVGISFQGHGAHPTAHDGGHLAMTYSALAVLAILGDDYSRVSRDAIVSSIRKLQQSDGSFSPSLIDKQSDMRFLFCAVAISVMLDDWNGVDRNKAVNFIVRSQSFDGGFGLSPGLEAHGGATYCALAALRLITLYDSSWPSSATLASLIDVDRAMKWCMNRQAEGGGFQGRPNKPADTCYAFWLGGSLRMFEIDHLCNHEQLRKFLISAQRKWGGFSKFPQEDLPDLLHSYYGICGFSLLGEPGLKPLAFELGITQRTANRLPGFGPKRTQKTAFD
ncbi:geranylgeranyl transferase type-1 subunit beta [Marchantia polymorpha subsp. ruderalis]|uniref:Geranylgeranyl transferase type-1 subunit beta n=2 Tax=Marchantia polymorpha TaxID=3197 RepID=A0AAF6BLK5_MARPO|nr:hypothetical protein MARPO_0010s0084 [Marchantia polymorpha]BBN12889.1 hypothetical protein Mp_5g23720 [Marchantia polymorpha subsp. ruderalis]|eukprot:PTQ46685.1 hypothetical protein MARPO_0010s0084 [Marchantia polymorpha]